MTSFPPSLCDKRENDNSGRSSSSNSSSSSSDIGPDDEQQQERQRQHLTQVMLLTSFWQLYDDAAAVAAPTQRDYEYPSFTMTPMSAPLMFLTLQATACNDDNCKEIAADPAHHSFQLNHHHCLLPTEKKRKILAIIKEALELIESDMDNESDEDNIYL